ncbi:MAG: 4-alpha-glucanotransferase [Lachnospiraceae bacterium]|nr:4-alpha-glucanotransferase [Lachnospiraceae bacterium]MDY5541033.1 4-alpha-glucanotransferase [Lachnospiraceae bacterium]
MRKSGVLMHISSLPSPHGIGSMGAAAREFVDFLKAAGQSCWQLLPICPTSYGDSPYQSFSTYAGNPYFIDLDELAQMGLLSGSEYEAIDWESSADDINYGALHEKRYPVLRKAAERFRKHPPSDYEGFIRENEYWLEDYALFMALKNAHGGASWQDWPKELKMREERALGEARRQYAQEAEFFKVLQYLFFRQWRALRSYANANGISIIGDLPIYVSLDGVDVWAHPELFQLDETLRPREVAGCPPDGFSETGQLWGNPLFDWDYMKKDGYTWWIRRIEYLCSVYDILRIDHFRGFDSYYAIPFGEADARSGQWRKGPGMELFREMERSIGRQPIIAEDLGYLTDSVRELLRESGFPGMKILEFGFDSRDANSSEYLPYKYSPGCVAYTGTHDNDTAAGWMTSAVPEDVARAVEYLGLNETEGYHWGMMRGLWASASELTIVQGQDLLGLGSEARMNTPSTVGRNWRWRSLPGSFTPELAVKLRHKMELYRRLPE